MTFVDEMADAVPPAMDCIRAGMTREEMLKFQSTFKCVRRKCALELPEGDALLRLIREWDISLLAIGILKFNQSPEQTRLGWHVGSVEIDPLVITAVGGEVVVLDRQTPHVLWPVAANSGELLKALPLAAAFCGKLAIGLNNPRDYSSAMKTAKECSIAAGGAKYLKFFYMLLGAEE